MPDFKENEIAAYKNAREVSEQTIKSAESFPMPSYGTPPSSGVRVRNPMKKYNDETQIEYRSRALNAATRLYAGKGDSTPLRKCIKAYENYLLTGEFNDEE